MKNSENQEITLSDGSPVPLRLIQDVHKEIYSKKQSIQQLFSDNHIIKYEDVHQLLSKLIQCIGQYKVLSKTCNVTVLHSNDSKAILEDFEQFSKYDTSTPSPVESIILELSFLLAPQEGSTTTQTFKIELILHSRAAGQNKAKQLNGLRRVLYRFGSQFSGSASIEHTDYLIGKFLHGTICDWYKTVKKNRNNKFLGFLQEHSGWLPHVFRIMSGVIFIFVNSDRITSDMQLSSLFYLISIFILLTNLSYKMGDVFEDYILRLSPLSALSFNKGDAELISNYNEENNQIIIKSIFSICIQLALAVISSLISVDIISSL